MSEGGNTLIKIFLFGVLFFGIIGVMSITYNIINSHIPNVMDNCVEGGLEQIHISNIEIVSSKGAKSALEPFTNDTPVFIGSVIETCGIGYAFESEENRYLVCEDGTISKYVVVCKNDTLVEKGSGYVSTLKDGASAGN